jgi:hypothetical protein
MRVERQAYVFLNPQSEIRIPQSSFLLLNRDGSSKMKGGDSL